MKTIASFTVNHDKLLRGMYISRIDGDVITYDIRMKVPNKGDYLTNSAMHTIEHLFATYVRNSRFSDEIIYVGPMGCRTGFYFLTRDTLTSKEAIALVQESMAFIAEYEGDIPGNERWQCGNYLDHDLEGARREGAAMFEVLKGWTPEQLKYEE